MPRSGLGTTPGGAPTGRSAAMVARAERALDFMDSHLAGQDWLVGPAISAADIALIAYTRAAEKGGLDLARRPALRAWIGRCEAVLDISGDAAMSGR